jgi:ADP-ribose pyrophosphatase YjhB (NUDIX family)
MPDIKVLWEGKLALSQIIWGDTSLPEFKLNSKYDIELNKFWLKHLGSHPNDYNGTLLYLYDFKKQHSNLVLNTGTIKFSTIIFMSNFNLEVNRGIGMLGVQCLIFNNSNDYLLVGRRANCQSYYPGALTIPGGMLELNDLNYPPKTSLMREILEEVKLNFVNSVYLIAILSGWNGISVTFLLSTCLNEPVDFSRSLDGDKEEWAEGLNWISVRELNHMNNNSQIMLDGLQYFKSKTKLS